MAGVEEDMLNRSLGIDDGACGMIAVPIFEEIPMAREQGALESPMGTFPLGGVKAP